jgi:hypothetical protein
MTLPDKPKSPIMFFADFERFSDPLLSPDRFTRRMLGSAALMVGLLSVCLGIGVVGYHVTAGLGWLDSLVNASMILGGMGPVDPVRTVAGKWFESIYAIFSGVAFLTSVGVLLAPVAHRALHHMHLDEKGED